MLLTDKVAIVSGVGPGLGHRIAVAFAREGADVVLGARTESYLEEVAGVIEGMGRRALPVPTNIAKADDCARIMTISSAGIPCPTELLIARSAASTITRGTTPGTITYPCS